MNRHRIPVPLSILLVATLLAFTAGPLVPTASAEDYNYFTPDPSRLDFSDQTQGTTSATRTITFTNDSPGAMTVSTISVNGPFAAALDKSSCDDGPIPIGYKCTVAVTFAPPGEGAYTGKLTLRNDYGTHLSTVDLSGNGVATTPANVAANPASLDFGDQTLDSIGGPQRVTFTNSGGTAATIGTVEVAVSGNTLTGEFYIGATTCSGVLNPETSCTVDLYFAPRLSLGTRTGLLMMSGNNGTVLASVALSGKGVSGGGPPLTVTAGFAATMTRGGADITLNATTSADTKCLVIAGDHSATLTDQTGRTSWTHTFTAGAGEGTRGVSVTAYSDVGCTGTSAAASPAPSYLLDNTPPITAHNAPSGWQQAASVTVTLTPTDSGGSGVASTSYALDSGATQTGTSLVVSGDGDHLLEFWSADQVGNIETHQTAHIKLDTTAPSITASAAPTPNASGWNNTTVTVTFACADATSPVSCPEPATIATEGASQVIGGTATDGAGNTASASATVSIDTTAPSLSGVPTTAPNALDWYNGDVTITWACSDPLSGIDPGACPLYGNVTGQGSAQTTTATVTDRAGNTGNGISTPVKIDRTAPTTTTNAPSGWSTGRW